MKISDIVTPADVAGAYDILIKARDELHHAVEQLAQRQIEFDRAHAAQVNSGGIVGKNEVEREARTRAILAVEYADLEAAKAEQRRAKCEYDKAQFTVDKLQAMLKLLDLTSKGD